MPAYIIGGFYHDGEETVDDALARLLTTQGERPYNAHLRVDDQEPLGAYHNILSLARGLAQSELTPILRLDALPASYQERFLTDLDCVVAVLRPQIAPDQSVPPQPRLVDLITDRSSHTLAERIHAAAQTPRLNTSGSSHSQWPAYWWWAAASPASA